MFVEVFLPEVERLFLCKLTSCCRSKLAPMEAAGLTNLPTELIADILSFLDLHLQPGISLLLANADSHNRLQRDLIRHNTTPIAIANKIQFPIFPTSRLHPKPTLLDV